MVAETDVGSCGYQVDICAIDKVMEIGRRVGVIQLDVEGYEKEVLLGAVNTIKKWKPIIILEVNPGDEFLNSGWFKRNILELGYMRTQRLHGNYAFSVNGKELTS